MSQLQIGLISLGALIILGVLMFNWSQERRIRRETLRRFDGSVGDVLMQAPQEEPVEAADEEFRIDHEVVAGEGDSPDEHIPEEGASESEMAEASLAEPDSPPHELEASPVESTPEAIEAAQTVAGLPENIDPQIDEVAIVTFSQPCSGSAIRDALQPLPEFSKPIRWLGLDIEGICRPLAREHEQHQFTRMIGALQLADRSGPAGGEDLRNFHAKVEDVTERLGGALEWREHGDPLQYARELDQFGIEVDVMVSLQLIAGGAPFAGTKLRGLAESAGLELKEDGQFHYVSDEGHTLFTLSGIDRQPLTLDSLRTAMLRGVMLLMDVPRVAGGVTTFNQMVTLGRHLETALAAKLVDENQQPLNEAAIDKIREQLKSIYSSMLARGIASGSATALRLFS